MKKTKPILPVLLLLTLALVVPIPRAEAQRLLIDCEVPYGFSPIRTPQELSDIRNHMGGKFFLCNDITLSGFFTPLGWSATGITKFSGTFEGNGHTIRNLWHSQSSADYLGLFSWIDAPGVIRNLTLENPIVVGCRNVGALAGAFAGTAENVHVSGQAQIKGACLQASNTGGLVGSLQSPGFLSETNVEGLYVQGNFQAGGLAGASNGTIVDSHSTVPISGSGYVGGLVGLTNGGFISNASARGEVQGGSYVGGLVGANINSTLIISNSFASGNVSGGRAGGLVASANATTLIENTYARGSATGNGSGGGPGGGGAAGLVFQLFQGSSITNSYAAGRVSGNGALGGLAGIVDSTSTVYSSYFNSSLNPSLTSGPDGVGKTALELKLLATFTGWDISYISDPTPSAWKIASPDGTSFPRLGWQ